METGKRVSRAIGSNLLYSATTAILQFGLTAIIGRILTPHDYGQFALAGSIVAISGTIGGRGLSIKLLRAEALSKSDISNAYVAAVIIASSIAAFLPIVSFLQVDRDRATLVQCCALIIVVNFASTPALALLQRDLRTAVIGKINLLAIFAGNGIVSICLALSGAGPWSLLVGVLTNSIITFLLSIVVARPNARLRLEPTGLLETLRQSMVVSGLRLLDTLWLQLPILFLTLTATTPELGLFQRMHFLSLLLFQVVLGSTIATILPEVAKNRLNPEILRAHFVQYLRISAFVAAAITVPGALYAKVIISVVIGPSWLQGASTFQPALFAGAFFAVSTLPVVFKEACGLNKQRYVVSSVSIVSLLLLTSQSSASSVAVAKCFALSAAIMFTLGVAFVTAWLKIDKKAIIKSVLPAVILGFVLAIVGTEFQAICEEFSIDERLSLIGYGFVVAILSIPPLIYLIPDNWRGKN